MSSLQFLMDAATRHQVFLQRYGGGQSKIAKATINRLRTDINVRLSQEPTAFIHQRLTDVLRDLNELSVNAFGALGRELANNAKDLSVIEAKSSVRLFNKVARVDFTLPSDDQIVANVMSQHMGINTTAGVTIEQALNDFTAKKTAQIIRTVADGVTLGDTTPAISRKVSTLLDTLTKRQADALTRTIVNNVSASARSLVYEENADIIDGYKWVATLDNRTTIICGSRDGKIYHQPHDPMPPAHYSCRSTTVPRVKPEYDIAAGMGGERPSVGKDGKATVSSRVTYGGWLRKQPKEFIDEALGVERSRLFRTGKIKLDKFIDPTGRVYNLSQLEQMNPIAFAEG